MKNTYSNFRPWVAWLMSYHLKGLVFLIWSFSYPFYTLYGIKRNLVNSYKAWIEDGKELFLK